MLMGEVRGWEAARAAALQWSSSAVEERESWGRGKPGNASPLGAVELSFED